MLSSQGTNNQEGCIKIVKASNDLFIGYFLLICWNDAIRRRWVFKCYHPNTLNLLAICKDPFYLFKLSLMLVLFYSDLIIPGEFQYLNSSEALPWTGTMGWAFRTLKLGLRRAALRKCARHWPRCLSKGSWATSVSSLSNTLSISNILSSGGDESFGPEAAGGSTGWWVKGSGSL